jgi:signal transduction histidine kinase
VDVRPLLNNAVDALRQEATEKGVDLRLALPDTAAPVMGDPDRLMQVVLNLLSNAIKFANSTIATAARLEDDTVHIDVTDDGPGIPPEKQEAIFEKFRQVDQPSGSQAGSGLGLAIAQQITAQHDGTLSVESIPGDGATFTVRLPHAPDPEATASSSSLPDR